MFWVGEYKLTQCALIVYLLWAKSHPFIINFNDRQCEKQSVQRNYTHVSTWLESYMCVFVCVHVCLNSLGFIFSESKSGGWIVSQYTHVEDGNPTNFRRGLTQFWDTINYRWPCWTPYWEDLEEQYTDSYHILNVFLSYAVT